MKIEDQICSLEPGNRLKELGVKQESLFYWIKIADDWKLTSVITEKDRIYFNMIKLDIIEKEYLSAFTVSELGEILPCRIQINDVNFYYHTLKIKDNYDIEKYEVLYENDKRCIFFQMCSNEANARAYMIIDLLENKLMELKNEKND